MVVRNGLNYKEAGLSGIVHFVTLASTKPAGSGGDWQVEEVYGNLECNECTRKRIRKLPAMGPRQSPRSDWTASSTNSCPTTPGSATWQHPAVLAPPPPPHGKLGS